MEKANGISSVNTVHSLTNGKAKLVANQPKDGKLDFKDQLNKAIRSVEKLQEDADKLSMEMVTGKDAPLHETMIALEKADISLRLLIQVRNKLIEAYKEVMHMQF